MNTATFTVKDKAYTLKYDFNAICEIEENAGVGIPTLVSQTKLGMFPLRVLIWGGLKWRDRGLTIEAVGDLIGEYIDLGGDIQSLFKLAVELVEKSLKKKGGSDEDPNVQTGSEKDPD
jgi:hypothetical protein